MIVTSNIEILNLKGAIRGLRNPMGSWKKSDSYELFGPEEIYVVGENDMALAQRMIKSGTDESKFMRQIFISMDIDAPLFWWKEMDQYRIGCTTNSCSTMHKLASTPITRECFSFDESLNNLCLDVEEEYGEETDVDYLKTNIDCVINLCETLRQNYLTTKDKRYWRALIELLPESWNQKRTWTANYQVLRSIYFARRNHKLDEWRNFCDIIKSLPYGEKFICWEDK